MKKILIVLFLILFTSCTYAQENLSFIYINGSNNNDIKMKNWYENGVKSLHPVLRDSFLKNRGIKKYYSNLGGLKIEENPVIFFWGFESKNDLDAVKNNLQISKKVSSKGSYLVRNLLTQFLHDAIWVQKSHNMIPILDELNEKVKTEAKKENRVVLYGYSAGTFITYEYLLQKLRYIDPKKALEALKADKDVLQFAQNHPLKNTCMSALSADNGGIATFSMSGKVLLNPNKENLKNNYLKLDNVTENVCAPEDKVFGVVNFASPLPLFYSDIEDENYELSYFNRYIIKYLYEQGLFFLTVNFKEDPLGYPTARNITIDDLEDIIDLKIENPKGFIYDASWIASYRMFPFAHTSYWSARRAFSNGITKNLVNGYKFQYDEKYQGKIIRQNRKKSEL